MQQFKVQTTEKNSSVHDVPQVIIIPVRNYINLPMVWKIAQSISGLGLPCSDAAAEKKLKSLILGPIRLYLSQHRRKRNGGEQKGEICCLLAEWGKRRGERKRRVGDWRLAVVARLHLCNLGKQGFQP